MLDSINHYRKITSCINVNCYITKLCTFMRTILAIQCGFVLNIVLLNSILYFGTSVNSDHADSDASDKNLHCFQYYM